jgi:hypothetical protein
VAGVLAIGTGSGRPAIEIAIATGAKRVSMASPPVSIDTLPRGGWVGPMLWEQVLPAALAEGRYVAAPAAEVVGTGLESIQPAMDRLGAGVSARRLVVTL